jgi:hypothetical protein
MTLIEHDEDSISLENAEIENYYYKIFRDELQKPNKAIRYSWFLGGSIPFTISMTAGDSRFGKINVEIKESRSGESKTKPM